MADEPKSTIRDTYVVLLLIRKFLLDNNSNKTRQS